MKIVLSWLNDFAPFGTDADAIAELLNDLGMAVDAVERVGTPIEGVIVAKVLDLRRHPDADKIQLVDVDTGNGEALQICCGAFNMKIGDLVPLASLGTTMPNGLEIARRKLRGQWSNGMLCSAAELQISSDHGGIYILPPDLPLGAPVFDALGITADVIFELDLTRNRPDAYSHLGVARDLAARLKLPFTPPTAAVPYAGVSDSLTIDLVDGDGCGRFTACVISGIQITDSPRWIADRLTRAGMRPINNVVDVSNYLMLELGRPNHAYDIGKLGGRGFRIRKAREGETMITLDGVDRTFTTADVLICDADDVAIGVGGIMGGQNTEVDEHTSAIALESAWFDPPTIASSVARLGLRSEASTRFERGCDWDDMELAARRFVELLSLTCPAIKLFTLVDAVGNVPKRSPVRVRTARVNAILGTALSTAEIADLIGGIGFVSSDTDAVGQSFTIPTWRYDTTTEIEIIEEIGRQYGFSRIAKTVPKSSRPGGLTPYQQQRRLVRDILIGLGCSEAMPNPFLAPGDLGRSGLSDVPITIVNPLDADESVLRTSLRPGLLKTVAYNESHRSHGVSLFEIGHVYRRPATPQPLPDEREFVAVVLAGRDARAAKQVWDELVSALNIADTTTVSAEPEGMHPTRSARLVSFDDDLGYVGEIDPGVLAAMGITERVAWLEVDLGAALARSGADRLYRRVSRYPSSDIDLAFVVADEVAADAVAASLRDGAGELAVAVRLFDVYRGAGVPAGSRSLAYALRLQAPDRTLTDAEVAAVRTRAIEAVTSRHGATLRG
ncbi:MAG: phenylalanine--tRNA ligase subunit beta [Acidimicrobiia bacterium]